MFNKKCINCGGKTEKNFIFCPYCGINIKREENRRSYGMLGADDDVENFDMGSMGLGGVFNHLMKELTKQMSDMDMDGSDFLSKGIKLNISSVDGKPVIRLNNQPKKEKEVVIKNTNTENFRKYNGLPRKEAEANVRRLSNKIVYEIELPGVSSMKNILITKLENSIEIKAFTDEGAYFKIIPVNLPITDYRLEKEKLILELNPKN